MQRRWEEQLAGYVAASFRVLSLGNTASQLRPARQQARDRGDALFRRRARHRAAACRWASSSPSTCWPAASAAPVLRLAQIWQDFHQARLSVAAPRRHPQHAGRADLQPGARGAAGDPRRRRLRARDLPLSHRRAGDPARCELLRCRRARCSASSARRARARARSPSWCSGSTCPRAAACWSTASISRMVDLAWLRRQIGVVLQENVLFNRTIRENIALADPGMPMRARDRRGRARRRARLHPRAARGLRHDRRRARQHPLGRAAPAHRHRPRAGDQSAHPDLRRGDQRARL